MSISGIVMMENAARLTERQDFLADTFTFNPFIYNALQDFR